MTVYVDDVELPYGRMKMCHMWADTEDELIAFARSLDPKLPRWIQRPPKSSWVHFDVSKALKAKAIAAGAVLMDKYGPVEHVARLRGDERGIDRVLKVRAAFGKPLDGRVI